MTRDGNFSGQYKKPGLKTRFNTIFRKLSIVSEASSFVLFLVSAFLTSFWFVIKTFLFVKLLLADRKYKFFATVLTYEYFFFHCVLSSKT